MAALALCLPLLLGTRVYYSEEEALAAAFPDATAIEPVTHLLDDAERERAAERSGRPVRDRLVIFHEAYRGDTWLGRALILKEVGKQLPFRFLVAIGPDASVQQVLLLHFREPRGGEIERAAFRAQYRGKTLEDPIRRGEDIRNITGATLSVDALTRGVRRALALSAVLGSAPPKHASASQGGPGPPSARAPSPDGAVR